MERMTNQLTSQAWTESVPDPLDAWTEGGSSEEAGCGLVTARQED